MRATCSTRSFVNVGPFLFFYRSGVYCLRGSDRFSGRAKDFPSFFKLTCVFDITLCTPNKFGDRETRHILNTLEMYEKQIRCDVEFHFENGRSIGRHIWKLSAKSPVFAAMFVNSREFTPVNKRRVEIKDIQPDVFDKMLQFIYSGMITDDVSKDDLQQLDILADKYELKRLKSYCAKARN